MNQEQGMTSIGMLFFALLIIFVGLMLMRIAPVYLQYYTVLQSIKGLKNIPATELSSTPEQNVEILKSNLSKRLAVNDIDEKTLQDITITPKNESTYDVSLKYKVIKPFVSNISFLFDFTLSEEITIATN